MKVALIHFWLVNRRGGEKVLEALGRMYPQADIYTHVCTPAGCAGLTGHTINTTFISRIPGSTRHYQKLLPLMPLALEQLDLRAYDLVISSESGPAKGVITRADTAHVCYCHTPMRYLWDFYQDYLESTGPFTRLMMRPLFASLRRWDVASAQRVDRVVVNSHTVARRVARWWRREATVVHPPIDVAQYATGQRAPDHDAPYLCLGQLVPYKRIDLAVAACAGSKRRLIVAGDGSDRERLEALARSLGAEAQISFRGRVDDAEAARLYSQCRALIFPGEEDFGMVPVEAQASGRPVIAYGRGGALETVRDGETGLLFPTQSVPALTAALDRFEAGPGFDPAALAEWATQFDEAHFRAGMQREIDKALAGVRTTSVLP